MGLMNIFTTMSAQLLPGSKMSHFRTVVFFTQNVIGSDCHWTPELEFRMLVGTKGRHQKIRENFYPKPVQDSETPLPPVYPKPEFPT